MDGSPESAIQFVTAQRSAARQIIAMIGPSGSGKTLSALYLARGLIGPQGKLLVIDTEKGRSTFYADSVQFQVAHFNPPFAPARYIAYLDAAEKAGADAVVIDSGSHEWAGIGGCSEMAEASQLKNDFAKWAFPKAQNKKYVNRLTNSGMHVIVCLRAQEKYKQIDDPDKPGRKMIVNDGFLPICEKNLVYELVISILMLPRAPGQTVGERVLLKCPDALVPIFNHPGWISENTGAQLARWIAGGAVVDRHLEALKSEGEEAALLGSEPLKAWFTGLSKEDKAAIKPNLEILKESAAAVDAENARLLRDTIAGNGEISFGEPSPKITAPFPEALAPLVPATSSPDQFKDGMRARLEAATTMDEFLAVVNANRAVWDSLLESNRPIWDAIDGFVLTASDRIKQGNDLFTGAK